MIGIVTNIGDNKQHANLNSILRQREGVSLSWCIEREVTLRIRFAEPNRIGTIRSQIVEILEA